MSTRSGNPKIRPDDYEALRLALLGSGIEHATTVRERWDALARTPAAFQLSLKLYSYLNDDHIDTALRKIVAGSC
jgi:hypothetical protein